jgi:hypothetical protein
MSSHLIRVNYGRTLEDAIRAGEYGLVSPDIHRRNFPNSSAVNFTTNIKIFGFDRKISTDDVRRHFASNKLLPGVMPELLALGETHPEVFYETPVIALGSVWIDSHKNNRVMMLHMNNHLRCLTLAWEGTWGINCRFIAVGLDTPPATRS